jgi:hypothetical protein
MSLAFVVPALYKIPKTFLSWATNPPHIPLLHVITITFTDVGTGSDSEFVGQIGCGHHHEETVCAVGLYCSSVSKGKKESSESLGYKFTDFAEHGFPEINTSSLPVTMFLGVLCHTFCSGRGWSFVEIVVHQCISHVFEYMFKHCYTIPVCMCYAHSNVSKML